MRKESFKTTLLIVLFVLSLALTQQLWIGIPNASILPVMKTIDKKQVEIGYDNEKFWNVISPQSFVISFGAENYTVFFSDSHEIWKESLRILAGYFQEDVHIEEIQKTQWDEMRDVRGIQLEFGYTMPLGILKDMVGGQEAGLIDKISGIDSVIIPVSDGANIYILDRSQEKYYRARGNWQSNVVMDIVNRIEQENESVPQNSLTDNKYDYYSTIQFSFGVENETIMPVELSWLTQSMPEISTVSELNMGDIDQVNGFASTFFGENFDFVKKIIEVDGSVNYMYGYGQKVLKVNASGGIEYVEVADDQKSGNGMGVGDAAKKAIEFVHTHGISPNYNIFLKDIRPTQKDNKKGYLFLFTYRMNGLPVYVESNRMQSPIEVEVMGNRVTYYKRLVKKEEIDASFLRNNPGGTLLAPKDVLIEDEKNLNTIVTDMRLVTENEDDMINEVLKAVRAVELGYYDYSLGENHQLIPVWRIQLGQEVYFFHGYNGQVLNTLKL